MKTKLTHTFDYNGMFLDTKPIPEAEQREVTILGVPLPADPGFILIQDGDKRRSVPTLVIDPRPNIDFEALLTKQQLKERKQYGGLLSCGLNTKKPKRDFIPIEECPLLPNLNIPEEFDAWAKEALSLAAKCNRSFCRDRKSKLERLSMLYRMGSQHLEHANKHLFDEDRLRTTLKKIEPVLKRQ